MTGNARSTSHQESYEELPSWPEGEPVPHLFPSKTQRGPLASVYHHIQSKLGNTSPSPLPPPVVTQLANSVRERLGFIYNTSFTVYHVVKFTQNSSSKEYGDGTLYIILIQISPRVQGHGGLMVKIFKSVNDTDYLVQHNLD